MADKALIVDAFNQCHVAHTFMDDRAGSNDLYSVGVRNMAWKMFKEAGERVAQYLRDVELERELELLELEWDCGHDVWQEDDDL